MHKTLVALEAIPMHMNWGKIFSLLNKTAHHMGAAFQCPKLYVDGVKDVEEMFEVPIQCASCNTAITFTDDDLLLCPNFIIVLCLSLATSKSWRLITSSWWRVNRQRYAEWPRHHPRRILEESIDYWGVKPWRPAWHQHDSCWIENGQLIYILYFPCNRCQDLLQLVSEAAITSRTWDCGFHAVPVLNYYRGREKKIDGNANHSLRLSLTLILLRGPCH